MATPRRSSASATRSRCGRRAPRARSMPGPPAAAASSTSPASSASCRATQPVLRSLAPRVTHAPHHVPKDWADKYKGKFDQGWDKLREETFARQKKLGVIPKESELTRRHPEIPAWES